MRCCIAVIIAGLLLPLVAQSQEIYRWVDKDGVVHYADQPGAPDAQRVPYPALGSQATDSEETPDLYTSDQPSPMPPGPTYQTMRIVSPTADQVFFGAGVTVPVQAELDRELRPGDKVVFFVDGSQVPASGGLSTSLAGLDRGQHTVRASVLDDAGSVVISSPQVTFYVRQPSVATPPTGPDVKPPARPPRRRPAMAGDLPAALPAIDPGQLLDVLATAVLVVDDRARVLHLNIAAEDMLAIGLATARGKRVADLLESGDRLESLVVRARVGGEALVQREWELVPVMRSDARYLVDCVLTPINLPGATGCVLVEISDTTRQVRISRENALLAQLGGSRMMARQLAHEIKNPLGGLRGAAQLLERELPDEALKEYTRVIIGEADRLRALVDSLLGPTRALVRQPANVHELLDHVYRLVRVEAPEAIVMVRDYDPSLPVIPLDRDQMIQAMLNLARNAVQALGNHGQLTFRTRAVTGATIGEKRHRVVAAVQFEDNGPGVPAELGETIFYPLVTARPGGTGLGLAVAQDIVTRHDGLVEFDSRPGRTVFSLLLPIETTHEPTA